MISGTSSATIASTQHVGERQQQAEPEAYENSSGAVKRKPTPRTVCR